MIIYGLNTCANSQKARKALEAAGKDVSFRDVRAEPLSEAKLAVLIAEFGDLLVDRKSNDWRALSDLLKYSEAEELRCHLSHFLCQHQELPCWIAFP